jgi:hypothetical protein
MPTERIPDRPAQLRALRQDIRQREKKIQQAARALERVLKLLGNSLPAGGLEGTPPAWVMKEIRREKKVRQALFKVADAVKRLKSALES